jgi:hypothetical protein
MANVVHALYRLQDLDDVKQELLHAVLVQLEIYSAWQSAQEHGDL